MKYKYIIFDLFGTLISDEEVIKKGNKLRESLSESEYESFVQHWKDLHRNNYSQKQFLNRVKQSLKLNDKTIKNIEKRISLTNIKPYKDTFSSLLLLINKGYILILLTNSPPIARKIFNKEKTLKSMFYKTYWSFIIGYLKPEKEIFKYVIDDLKCSKNEVVVIGDSYEKDYLGAQNAGLDVMLIDRQNKYKLENKIQSLSELKDYL